jgi:hypothetical protein
VCLYTDNRGREEVTPHGKEEGSEEVDQEVVEEEEVAL